jgi:hypothetical protein
LPRLGQAITKKIITDSLRYRAVPGLFSPRTEKKNPKNICAIVVILKKAVASAKPIRTIRNFDIMVKT